MQEIGIYIHIPFCKQKCRYCDFTSFANRNEYMQEYINKLKDEIRNEDVSKYNVKTAYIGGGTPSYIDSNYIIEILNLIDKKNCKEITIEVNPGTVTKQKLQDYYNAGINRLSIGLQTTNDELLKKIGRIHTFEEFCKTYNLAREVGFKNINVDLMIGLPTQTIENIKDSLDIIIDMKPEHISVYSLILEEGTVLEQMVNSGKLTMLDEKLEREMYWYVKKRLEKEGFKHYEISNFAKENFESKHNLACWEQKEYLGFGLAAHSYINKTRYSNTEILSRYLEDAKENRQVHEIQDSEAERKEYMLLGLRKLEGINIQNFKNKFIENPIYIYREELNKLAQGKLIEIDTNNIKLTNQGIDLANLVWEEFV